MDKNKQDIVCELVDADSKYFLLRAKAYKGALDALITEGFTREEAMGIIVKHGIGVKSCGG